MNALFRWVVVGAVVLGTGAEALADSTDAPLAPARPVAEYQIEIPASIKGLVGQQLAPELVVIPAAGRKVHPKAPMNIVLQAKGALRLAKERLGQKDTVYDEAGRPHWPLVCTGTKVGDQVLRVSATFFICTDTWCKRFTEQRSIAVAISK